MRSLRPVTLKYSFGMVHPAIEVIDEPLLVFLMCCAVQVVEVTVTELPEFQPNDFLFSKHADRGEEQWEVFAWAVRDVMAKVGQLGVSDINFKQKMAIYEFYTGRRDEVTLEDGETLVFRADGDYESERVKKKIH